MNISTSTLTARREFLKFLAASPYVAALGGTAAFLERTVFAQSAPQSADVIADPKAAITVFDFEEAAHRKVTQGHWAYMVSGVDDDGTIRANRAAFSQVQLRPRRLRDATKVDMRVELFGTAYNSPIFICPVGGQKAFHPEGEVAVARAAKARGTLQVSVHGNLQLGRRRQSRPRPPGLVPILCPQLLGRLRTDVAPRRSGRLHGDRSHRGQHHRSPQRNLPAHAPERRETVRSLPRRRARRARKAISPGRCTRA